MTVAQNIRDIAQEARPIIRQSLDIAVMLADIRDAAKEKGINWTQLKSLLIAEAKDAEDGGERLKDLTEKFDLALTYANMLLSKNMAERQTNPPQSTVADTSSKLSTTHPPEISSAASPVVSPRAEEACGEAPPDTPPTPNPNGGASKIPDDELNEIPPHLRRNPDGSFVEARTQ